MPLRLSQDEVALMCYVLRYAYCYARDAWVDLGITHFPIGQSLQLSSMIQLECLRQLILQAVNDEAVYRFAKREAQLDAVQEQDYLEIHDLDETPMHDLKHIFGRRLRAAGVSFEDRQDLLGHKSGRITTHYSAAELGNFYEAANKVCKQGNGNYPTLTMLKRDKVNFALSHSIDIVRSRKSHAPLRVVNV